MSSKKVTIKVNTPILPGRVSEAMLPCGKKNCACKAEPPKLHGPYYRWTGIIGGRQTSRTLSQEVAAECLKRIEAYRELKEKVRQLAQEGLDEAPWKK